MLVPIHVLSWDGQSISGYSDRGGAVYMCPSMYCQSISGSQDTLTVGGVQCTCAHPCTVQGWSEYVGMSGYSDRVGGGAVCMCPPCTVPGWSEYLGISGYSDRGGGGGGGAVCMCPSMYCPGMVRVSRDLAIL